MAVKKPKKSRAYNNSGRSEKSEQTRINIIEALVALLVERRGQDVPMEDLAKKTGITQRTIFRFFNDKKTLHAAMDTYLLSYLQAGTEQMQSLDFIGFAKNAYALFDKHRQTQELEQANEEDIAELEVVGITAELIPFIFGPFLISQ